MQIVKVEEEELPIPTIWRQTFIDIVEAFKQGDFRLKNSIESVHPLTECEAERIERNIADYGDVLESLPDTVWTTSVYRWMRGHWEVLIDLYTQNEGLSDLVMFVKVTENEMKYWFTVESIHVP